MASRASCKPAGVVGVALWAEKLVNAAIFLSFFFLPSFSFLFCSPIQEYIIKYSHIDRYVVQCACLTLLFFPFTGSCCLLKSLLGDNTAGILNTIIIVYCGKLFMY